MSSFVDNITTTTTTANMNAESSSTAILQEAQHRQDALPLPSDWPVEEGEHSRVADPPTEAAPRPGLMKAITERLRRGNGAARPRNPVAETATPPARCVLCGIMNSQQCSAPTFLPSIAQGIGKLRMLKLDEIAFNHVRDIFRDLQLPEPPAERLDADGSFAVYVHYECILGVDSRYHRTIDKFIYAISRKCMYCEENGAGLKCSVEECSAHCHYLCAHYSTSAWEIYRDTSDNSLKLKCPRHRTWTVCEGQNGCSGRLGRCPHRDRRIVQCSACLKLVKYAYKWRLGAKDRIEPFLSTLAYRCDDCQVCMLCHGKTNIRNPLMICSRCPKLYHAPCVQKHTSVTPCADGSAFVCPECTIVENRPLDRPNQIVRLITEQRPILAIATTGRSVANDDGSAELCPDCHTQPRCLESGYKVCRRCYGFYVCNSCKKAYKSPHTQISICLKCELPCHADCTVDSEHGPFTCLRCRKAENRLQPVPKRVIIKLQQQQLLLLQNSNNNRRRRLDSSGAGENNNNNETVKQLRQNRLAASSPSHLLASDATHVTPAATQPTNPGTNPKTPTMTSVSTRQPIERQQQPRPKPVRSRPVYDHLQLDKYFPPQVFEKMRQNYSSIQQTPPVTSSSAAAALTTATTYVHQQQHHPNNPYEPELQSVPQQQQQHNHQLAPQPPPPQMPQPILQMPPPAPAPPPPPPAPAQHYEQPPVRHRPISEDPQQASAAQFEPSYGRKRSRLNPEVERNIELLRNEETFGLKSFLPIIVYTSSNLPNFFNDFPDIRYRAIEMSRIWTQLPPEEKPYYERIAEANKHERRMLTGLMQQGALPGSDHPTHGAVQPAHQIPHHHNQQQQQQQQQIEPEHHRQAPPPVSGIKRTAASLHQRQPTLPMSSSGEFQVPYGRSSDVIRQQQQQYMSQQSYASSFALSDVRDVEPAKRMRYTFPPVESEMDFNRTIRDVVTELLSTVEIHVSHAPYGLPSSEQSIDAIIDYVAVGGGRVRRSSKRVTRRGAAAAAAAVYNVVDRVTGQLVTVPLMDSSTLAPAGASSLAMPPSQQQQQQQQQHGFHQHHNHQHQQQQHQHHPNVVAMTNSAAARGGAGGGGSLVAPCSRSKVPHAAAAAADNRAAAAPPPPAQVEGGEYAATARCRQIQRHNISASLRDAGAAATAAAAAASAPDEPTTDFMSIEDCFNEGRIPINNRPVGEEYIGGPGQRQTFLRPSPANNVQNHIIHHHHQQQQPQQHHHSHHQHQQQQQPTQNNGLNGLQQQHQQQSAMYMSMPTKQAIASRIHERQAAAAAAAAQQQQQQQQQDISGQYYAGLPRSNIPSGAQVGRPNQQQQQIRSSQPQRLQQQQHQPVRNSNYAAAAPQHQFQHQQQPQQQQSRFQASQQIPVSTPQRAMLDLEPSSSNNQPAAPAIPQQQRHHYSMNAHSYPSDQPAVQGHYMSTPQPPPPPPPSHQPRSLFDEHFGGYDDMDALFGNGPVAQSSNHRHSSQVADPVPSAPARDINRNFVFEEFFLEDDVPNYATSSAMAASNTSLSSHHHPHQQMPSASSAGQRRPNDPGNPGEGHPVHFDFPQVDGTFISDEEENDEEDDRRNVNQLRSSSGTARIPGDVDAARIGKKPETEFDGRSFNRDQIQLLEQFVSVDQMVSEFGDLSGCTGEDLYEPNGRTSSMGLGNPEDPADLISVEAILNAYLSLPPVSATCGVDPGLREHEVIRCRGLDHLIDIRIGDYRLSDLEEAGRNQAFNEPGDGELAVPTAEVEDRDWSVLPSCEICGSASERVDCVFVRCFADEPNRGGVRRLVCSDECARTCYLKCRALARQDDQPAESRKAVDCALCQRVITQDQKCLTFADGQQHAHSLCALFCTGVVIDPFNAVHGLTQAFKQSQSRECAVCRNAGAGVVCPLCSSAFHFPCLPDHAHVDQTKRTVMCCVHSNRINRNALERNLPRSINVVEPPNDDRHAQTPETPESATATAAANHSDHATVVPLTSTGQQASSAYMSDVFVDFIDDADDVDHGGTTSPDDGAADRRRFKVYQSTIHGLGLLTMSAIKRGEHVFDLTDGQILELDNGLAFRYLIADGQNCVTDGRRHQSSSESHTNNNDNDNNSNNNRLEFVNHSCTPNSEIVAVPNDQEPPKLVVRAIREIAEGEEITISYPAGIVQSNQCQQPINCLCRSASCRKWIN